MVQVPAPVPQDPPQFGGGLPVNAAGLHAPIPFTTASSKYHHRQLKILKKYSLDSGVEAHEVIYCSQQYFASSCRTNGGSCPRILSRAAGQTTPG
jgi:hypothetical protein